MTYPPSLPRRQRVGVSRRSLYISIVFTVLGLLCLGLIGCASPTAPTQAQAVDLFLRWELTAPGCEPTRPTPHVAGEPAVQRIVADDGTTEIGVWAVWPTTPRVGAVFVSMGGFYGVCAWGYERGAQ